MEHGRKAMFFMFLRGTFEVGGGTSEVPPLPQR